jgi:hypothetical protein
MQSPVHYFSLIHFILHTQTCTVMFITSCSYARPKTKSYTFPHTQTEQTENNIYNLTMSTRNIPLWLLSVMCYYTVGISQETWLTYSTWLFHSPSYRSAKICLTSSPHDYVLLPPPNTDIAACWESCLWCDSAPSTHVSLTALQICWQ